MDALLLLGPTGVGKTPLGELLAARGALGRRCVHVDFGALLRRAAADPDAAPGLDAHAHGVIRRVLAEGALLEDAEFRVAEVLLRDALRAQRAGPKDWLVLNGLPRHVGQARAIDAAHRVRAVLAPWAPLDVLLARIRRDTGGDRKGREDDGAVRIAARVARYEARTPPLLDHYRRRGVPICAAEVAVDTSAEALHEALRVQVRTALQSPS